MHCLEVVHLVLHPGHTPHLIAHAHRFYTNMAVASTTSTSTSEPFEISCVALGGGFCGKTALHERWSMGTFTPGAPMQISEFCAPSISGFSALILFSTIYIRCKPQQSEET